MLSAFYSLFLVVVFITVTNCFYCLDAKCDCDDGRRVVTCSSSNVEWISDMTEKYTHVVVTGDDTCDEVMRLRAVVYPIVVLWLKEPHGGCTPDSDSGVVSGDHDVIRTVSDGVDWSDVWSHVCEAVGIILMVLCWIYSAKVKHDVLPYVRMIPKDYRTLRRFLTDLMRHVSN